MDDSSLVTPHDVVAASASASVASDDDGVDVTKLRERIEENEELLARISSLGHYLTTKRVGQRHQFRQQALQMMDGELPLALPEIESFVSDAARLRLRELTRDAQRRPPQIFIGVRAWANGHVRPSLQELRTLMNLHGGVLENVLVANCTHWIADNLPLNKINEIIAKKFVSWCSFFALFTVSNDFYFSNVISFCHIFSILNE